MKIGLAMVSVVLGVRFTDGVLRDVVPEPVEPPVRCAAATAASKKITTDKRVLNRTNLNTIGASSQLQNVTPNEPTRGENLKENWP
jgi:hypothetical protein